MAVEKRRGCGYRKVGGTYLVSGGGGMPCDRLPILLDVCPTCSQGIKQTRGWTWIDVAKLVGGNHVGLAVECFDGPNCPLCFGVEKMGRAGLMWIGEAFYKTPQDFAQEGYEMGFSRRIKAVPRGFHVGSTWVLLAHPKAVHTAEIDTAAVEKWKKEHPLLAAVTDQAAAVSEIFAPERVPDVTFEPHIYKPGVFHVWMPQRVEKLVLESQRGTPEIEALIQQGITPVFIPDDDKDHQGSVYEKLGGSPTEEDETEVVP